MNCPRLHPSRLIPVLFVMTVLASGIVGPAHGQTWNGPFTDWNNGPSWSGGVVPNSPTAAVFFTGNSVGAVNLSASVQTQSLTFSNPTGSYVIGSSAGLTMSGVSAITIGAGVTATQQINFALVGTGSLLFPSGNLTITNNSTAPVTTLTVGAFTVIGTIGSGGVVVAGQGMTQISGSFASNAAPNNQVVGGVTKTGPGLLQFSGNGANLNGGLTLNGGVLFLDYTVNNASKLGGGSLVLDGGLLQMGYNFGSPVTQAIPGGTFVSAGHTDIFSTTPLPGGSTLTLGLGSITRSAGATLDVTPSSVAPAFTVTTSTNNFNLLLGTGPAFATINGGATWATASGGAIVGVASYGSTYTAGTNVDIGVSSGQSGITANSFRFSANTPTLTFTGTNTLQSGGILVAPSGNGGAIAGGTLTSSTGELIVHQYSTNGSFTINSAIVAAGGLTKAGPGLLVLGGTNTGLTGPININRGNLNISSVAAVNSASQINFNDDRVTLGNPFQSFAVDLANNTNGTIVPPVRLSAFSPFAYGTSFTTLFGNSRITLAGVLSSAPGLTTPIRFVAGSDNSGYNLTNTNTFTGNIGLFQGFLGITSDASLGNPVNVVTLANNDTAFGGLDFLNSGINVARPVIVAAPTRIVSNGADNNTISGLISGNGGIYKDGTGSLTITNAGNTVVNTFGAGGDGVIVAAGTLSLGATGVLPAATNITVGSGATFSPGTTGNILSTAIGIVTLNGGTFRVSTGTGKQYIVNQIVTNAAGGTVDYTGAGTDTLTLASASPVGAAITVNGNSTWLSPANGTTILSFNFNGASFVDVPITIPTGVTLNNGIALAGAGGGFRVTGGGTLFQNSDATNVVSMTAPLTIVQSRFRVTDASSNGGFGNFGGGVFTLDGGTFAYGGTTATTFKAMLLTANGATIQIESAAATLTDNGTINGPGGLTKIGPGTLVLNNTLDSFNALTINAGTVQTANDNTLGTAATILVGGAGTLLYTANTATARTFNLNFGTLQAATGATVTLNGAAVIGGFMRGPGTFAITGGTALSGVTTSASTTINQTGTGSFVNFNNGGVLAIAAGLAAPSTFTTLTNQGSGAITIGAASAVNASDFQTYGLLTLNQGPDANHITLLTNAGPSQMYFNGGSRTFIGVPPPAGQFSNAAIDLNGKNAIVAGGLFVNNGYVVDGSNGGTGLATIVADFGALVKGAGFFQNTVATQNGGKFQAGNSPGTVSFGKFIVGPGGVDNYVFAIDDATGVAGPSPDALGQVSGWGLVKAIRQPVGTATTSGDFTWTATSAAKLTVAIDTLINPTTVGTDVAGPMADFDPTQAYIWPAIQWAGTYSGPTDAATLNADTAFDTSGFVNPVAGTFGWALNSVDHSLSLTYTPTPVPEPGTLALLTASAGSWLTLRRRHSRQPI